MEDLDTRTRSHSENRLQHLKSSRNDSSTNSLAPGIHSKIYPDRAVSSTIQTLVELNRSLFRCLEGAPNKIHPRHSLAPSEEREARPLAASGQRPTSIHTSEGKTSPPRRKRSRITAHPHPHIPYRQVLPGTLSLHGGGYTVFGRPPTSKFDSHTEMDEAGGTSQPNSREDFHVEGIVRHSLRFLLCSSRPRGKRQRRNPTILNTVCHVLSYGVGKLPTDDQTHITRTT